MNSSQEFRDTRHYAHYEEGVRESMTPLPSYMQGFLTWVTGHAINGQKPTIKASPIVRMISVIASVSFFVFGITYLWLESKTLFWFVFPVYMIVATGSLRSLQLVYGHHAVHGAMSRNKKINHACAVLCTTLPLVMNEYDYRKTHISHHKFRDFCTEEDDDSKFLMLLGFKPGVSRAGLWARFLLSPINPVFHWRFLVGRVRSNFFSSSATQVRKLASIFWCLMILWYAFEFGLSAFLLIVLIPLFFLYNFSALINFMTEHSWMNEEGAVKSKDQYNSKCWGRFCGSRYPADRNIFSKCGWWLGLFLGHLPVRLFALVGDVTVHDVHHLYSYPKNRLDWVNDVYRRQELLASDQYGMAQRELWGLYKTIDSVFIGISRRA